MILPKRKCRSRWEEWEFHLVLAQFAFDGTNKSLRKRVGRCAISTAQAALAELDRMSRMHFSNTDLPATLRQEYEHTLLQSADLLRELQLNQQDIQDEELLWVRRRLLLAEKDEVINAFQHGILNQETHNPLLADIDARLLRIESGEKLEPPRV